MIYVKNNMRFAVMFKAEKDGREQRFEFDCLRRYRDTGNIATTGVTPMDEADFDFLYENSKQFKSHVDEGLLVKTKESGVTTQAQKMDSLEAENKLLKKQLAEKTKEASTATSDEVKEKDDEIASLKAQIEALKKTSKKGKTEAKVDESEGF